LINTYHKTSITYVELNHLSFSYEPFILSVEKEGVNYEFFIRIKEDVKNLLVFGSGAYNPEKMKPPIFQRHTWIDMLEESMILYNDPTLYLGPMSLGWGHGTTKSFYLEEIADILQLIMNRINVAAEDTIFYGSSGGGFMSMILAGFIKGSTALVNNPQTIVTNYYQSHVNRLLETAHPGISREEVLERFKTRLNVIEFFKKINYVPNILYLQNIACDHDMQKHVTPFISELKDLANILGSHPIKFEFYCDKEKGHNPLDLEETLPYFEILLLIKR
jgi:hypothetical protein